MTDSPQFMDREPVSTPTTHGSGGDNRRFYVACGVCLLLFVAVLSAVNWSLYPVFVDTYYHMAAINGFAESGGVTTHAHWELAPGGRVHIYPPALHAVGALFTVVGITARDFITFLSWACYAACMAATWIWLYRILGARTALFAVVLLCGPSAFFWNQTAHSANAISMLAAPLALLALESERFLACGVLNLVAISAHPMGLFLPPALVINTLLRRKRVVAGFLAAAVPVALYGPWLAHVWACLPMLSESREVGSLSLGGHGATIGVVAAACAVLGLIFMLAERGRSLGLLGPALGFAIVLPLGFAGRFLVFNVHWPLACFGAFGLAELTRRLERRGNLRLVSQVGTMCIMVFALLAFPSLELRPRGRGGPGGPGPQQLGPAGPQPTDRAGPPQLRGGPDQRRPRGRPGLDAMGWRVAMTSSLLAKLCEPQPAISPGGGPMPADGALIHQPGANEFFEALRSAVGAADVVFVSNPPGAALLTGATGRWTTSGILRDVVGSEAPAEPKDGEFAAFLERGSGPRRMPLRAQRQQPSRGPAGFEKVFENDFGSLWRNPERVEHNRKPAPARVPLAAVLVIVLTGLFLIAFDLAPAGGPRARLVAAVIACIVCAACLAPLTATAVSELRNPPTPPPQSRRGPPGGPQRAAEADRYPEITRLYRRIQEAVEAHFDRGERPDYFWPRENEERFHELMRNDQIDEARELLREGLEGLRGPEPPR